jgi:hypothetical protein
MNPQELDKMLEDMMFAVMQLRAQQVQFLAESDREPESKIHFRKQGNAAYKRFQELHQQLSESLRATIS